MLSSEEERAVAKHLFDIGKSIKRVSSEYEVNAVRRQLNEVARAIPDGLALLRARYLFLNGVLLSKVARRNLTPSQGSVADQAQSALRQFASAIAALDTLPQTLLRGEIDALRDECLYESAVVSALLLGSHITPEIMLPMYTLGSRRQRQIEIALKNGRSLRSRY